MIMLLVLLIILIPVLAGSYALVTYMRSWAAMRREAYLSYQGQRLHNESLRAIELAKAWEKAMKPDSTPQLPKGKEPEPEFVDHVHPLLEPEITMDDIEKSGYDPLIVDKYREQMMRKAQLRTRTQFRGSGP